jgi:hypothetical protein
MPSRSVSVPRPATEAVQLVRRAIEEAGLEARNFEERSGGGFACVTRAGLTSWGSRVTVSVKGSTDSTTDVSISVGPLAQLIDWGRSAGELSSILTALDRLL